MTLGEKFACSEPMKYWSLPPAMDKATRKSHLEKMITSGSYLYSLKSDGNFARAIIEPENKVLQSRGISKVTGKYGELQDRVFFWEALSSAFEKTTVILGELYLEGGIDRDVGSVCRSKPEKAKSIQDEDYYKEISKTVKFSAKDKRDIEGNAFRNTKLAFRIFDVLAYEGEDIMSYPIEERIKCIPEIVKKVNHPLVRGVKYREMDENFFDNLARIFSAGGEGVVCYRKGATYIPGKRGPSAWDTVKVKQEIAEDIDCFIYGTEPAAEAYTGKEVGSWKLWKNIQTDEMLFGEYFGAYQDGSMSIIPVSKGHFYGWPGAIYCAVFDENHKPYVICKCAGLTDDFKEELKNNYEKYHMMPIKITGMMVSESEGYSIRHPKLVSLRDNDISIEDCTIEKIKAQS